MNDAELKQLYEKYSSYVHRRCMAILQNRADADDALQEVFLRLRRCASVENSPNTLPWLYTIASHCCFNMRRGESRAKRRAKVQSMGLEHTGTPGDSDRRALLGAILRKFDSKTRQIGILHHMDGYTQEEVADQTGYSRKTVGKKLKAFEEAFQRLWLGGQRVMSNE